LRVVPQLSVTDTEAVTEKLGYKSVLIIPASGENIYVAFSYHLGEQRDTDWYLLHSFTRRKFSAPKGKKIWYVFYKTSVSGTTNTLDIVAFNGDMNVPATYFREAVLDSSATRTSSGAGNSRFLAKEIQVCITVNVTAVGGTPTLDIKVQASHDGTNYGDLYKKNSQNASTDQIKLPQITTTGTYVLQFDIYAQYMRLYWTIGGTTPSFTFSTSLIRKGVIHE